MLDACLGRTFLVKLQLKPEELPNGDRRRK
jgi:hypothetical protein